MDGCTYPVDVLCTYYLSLYPGPCIIEKQGGIPEPARIAVIRQIDGGAHLSFTPKIDPAEREATPRACMFSPFQGGISHGDR